MIPGENQFWFPVGPCRVLFVDDMYVARAERLSKKLHRPVNSKMAYRSDRRKGATIARRSASE